MGKSKDAKKNVKKEAAKTPKEKKAEKRLKKSKQDLRYSKKKHTHYCVSINKQKIIHFLNHNYNSNSVYNWVENQTDLSGKGFLAVLS